MSVEEKKFHKLFKELQFHQSELEYILEILRTAHWDFEEYYRGYCNKKDINVHDLDKKHQDKIDKLIPKPRKQTYDSRGILQLKKKTEMIDNTDMKEFKKIYREIAKILHPDVGGDEKQFKEITDAFSEKRWSALLEACEKYNIPIENYKAINLSLERKIVIVKGKIKQEKSTYSWLMYECADNEICKSNVVKKFLKHLFDYGNF
jgi:hypothetical protein